MFYCEGAVFEYRQLIGKRWQIIGKFEVGDNF